MRPTAYRRNARGLLDRQAFEQVRMQAGELFAAGRSQAEVARTLGVARQTSAAGTPAGDPVGCRHWQAAAPPGLTRACRIPSVPLLTRRCAKVPARTASTPTTGPWPASPL
jgi:hypothetical protein